MERQARYVRRRDIIKGAGVAGIAGLAGCTGGSSSGTSGTESTGGTTETTSSGGGGSTSSSSDTLTIGAPLALSGTYAALGEGQKRAVEFFTKQLNDSGGINGRPVKIVQEDTKSEADTANQKVQKLVEQDGVDVVIGLSNSSAALAVAPYLEQHDVPFLPVVAADAVTGSKCQRNMFRLVSRIGGIQANVFAEFGPTLGENVWLHYADYSWGQSGRDGFKRAIENGGKNLNIVGTSASKLGTNDFSSYISSIINSDADWVLTLLIGGDVINWANQAASNGLHRRVADLGPGYQFKSIRGAVGPKLAQGGQTYTFVPYYEQSGNAGTKKFVKEFQQRMDKVPGYLAAHWYAAAQFYQAAVEQGGSAAAADVISNLEQVDVTTPFGPTTFRECDHQGLFPVFAGKLETQQNDYGLTAIANQQTYQPDQVALTCQQAGCSF